MARWPEEGREGGAEVNKTRQNKTIQGKSEVTAHCIPATVPQSDFEDRRSWGRRKQQPDRDRDFWQPTWERAHSAQVTMFPRWVQAREGQLALTVNSRTPSTAVLMLMRGIAYHPFHSTPSGHLRTKSLPRKYPSTWQECALDSCSCFTGPDFQIPSSFSITTRQPTTLANKTNQQPGSSDD